MNVFTPALRALVDGHPATTVDIADRGLAYGDGVFETMAVVSGAVPLLHRHLARLALGCTRLGIEAPSASLIEAELAALVAAVDAGVAKLIVTRGKGARGYAPPRDAAPTRILSLHAPPLAAIGPGQGISVRWCATTLAINSRLAGIKHLNRLEQVLARANGTIRRLPKVWSAMQKGVWWAPRLQTCSRSFPESSSRPRSIVAGSME